MRGRSKFLIFLSALMCFALYILFNFRLYALSCLCCVHSPRFERFQLYKCVPSFLRPFFEFAKLSVRCLLFFILNYRIVFHSLCFPFKKTSSIKIQTSCVFDISKLKGHRWHVPQQFSTTTLHRQTVSDISYYG